MRFSCGAADTTGAVGQYNVNLWGPGLGGGSIANGLPATSPDGGNFIAFDSVFQNPPGASLDQTVNGLIVGQQYTVSFYEAAAQQFGFSGDTFDQWQVTFGTETQVGTAFAIPNNGFSGWVAKSLTFTASATSQTLSFFATGGPSGVPPFALLDGVSVQAVPEPSALAGLGAIMVLGLGAGLKSKLRNKQ